MTKFNQTVSFHHSGDYAPINQPGNVVDENYARPGVQIAVEETAYRTVQQYHFHNHFHPFTGDFLKKIKQQGLKSFMDATYHQSLEDSARSNFFEALYNPQQGEKHVVIFEEGTHKKVETAVNGAYSVYNWELFFHVPLTIGVHLSKNQRFAEAQQWFHFIFDPTNRDTNIPAPGRFWNFKAFRQGSEVELIDQLLTALSKGEDSKLVRKMEASIEQWRNQPFQPHAIARTRLVAYQMNVVMKYLDNLLAWGDQLFRQDTIETLNEATQLYVLAANILGEKPQKLPSVGKSTPKTYAQLKQNLDAFSNALVTLENQFPFNSSLPGNSSGNQGQMDSLLGLGSSLYFCIPKNDQLLTYWDKVADRLFKIRNCMNIQGVVRQLPLFQPPIDPGLLVKAAAAGVNISEVVSGFNQPVSPVRAQLLIMKALEICNEVKSLGGNLLATLEKKDAEGLSQLRQQQEIRLMELASDTHLLQWKEAEANTEALIQSRETIYERYRYYQMLLGKTAEDKSLATLQLTRKQLLEGTSHQERKKSFNAQYSALIAQYTGQIALEPYAERELVEGSELYLNKNENADLNVHGPKANMKQQQANGVDLITTILGLYPSIGLDTQPVGVGAHVEFGGLNLALAGQVASGILRAEANQDSFKGSQASKTASYQRRAQDWTLQSNLAAKELAHMGRQIIASLIREQIAQHAYENHQQQLLQAQEINAFLQDKFTNQELYHWMQSEVSKGFYEAYQFAYQIAKKAEQTLKWELMRPEADNQSFIKFNYWDHGKKGLLSGEALYLDIKRMEMAYHDYNKRELELTKHVSVKQLSPSALLQLKSTGTCTLDIPEWLFDLDGPGHYMRRIKNVAVSIPAITGPYTNVSCTLSLQKSSVRKSYLLKDGQYARQEEDERFVDYPGNIQSVVTSNGQNDSGLFEVNLRDERFLPFENAGVISSWQLELPAELRQFDYHQITDIILHVNYTARMAGGVLKEEAINHLKNNILGSLNEQGLSRLFSLSHDFPNEWYQWQTNGRFGFELKKEHLHYLAQGQSISGLQMQLWSVDQAHQLHLENQELISTDMVQIIGHLNTQQHTIVDLDGSQLSSDKHYFLLINYAVG